MDHLAENPRIRMRGLDLWQHSRPERARHRIRGVESPTGSPAIQPVVHHTGHIVNGLIGRMVQRYQIVVPLEHIQSGFAIIADMRADQTVPRVIGRIQAAGGFVKRRLNGRMIAAYMVEHAIQYHLQTHIPAGSDQPVECSISSQPHIDVHMVKRVIPVRRRFEYRTEQQTGSAQVTGIFQPRNQRVKATAMEFARAGGTDIGAAESQRVHVPEHPVLHPFG